MLQCWLLHAATAPALPAELLTCDLPARVFPPVRRSLDTGLDGAWVRSIRLSTPLACQTAISWVAAECVPAAPANLSVYIGDLPPRLLLGDTAGAAAGSLCAASVAVPGGQPLEIDCGRFMHGAIAVVVGLSLVLAVLC